MQGWKMQDCKIDWVENYGTSLTLLPFIVDSDAEFNYCEI